MLFQGWRNALGRWLLAEQSDSQQPLIANEPAGSEASAKANLAVHPEALETSTIPQHWLNKVSTAPPAHWLEKVREGAPELWESLAADLINEPDIKQSNEESQPEHVTQSQPSEAFEATSSQQSWFQENPHQSLENSPFPRSLQVSSQFQSTDSQFTQSVAVQPSADTSSPARSFPESAVGDRPSKDLFSQANSAHNLFPPDNFPSDIFSEKSSQQNGFSSVSFSSTFPPAIPAANSSIQPKSTDALKTTSVICSIAPQRRSSSPPLVPEPFPSLRLSSTTPPAYSSPTQPTTPPATSPAPVSFSLSTQYSTPSTSPPPPHHHQEQSRIVSSQRSEFPAAKNTSVPTHYWPSLPPPPTAPPTDLTRDRQHHQRLEQEQQGKPWNELRF